MQTNRFSGTQAFALLGILATFILAYALDAWTNALVAAAQSTFRFQPAIWASLAANLVFALGLIALTWLVLVRERPHRLVASACVILGLLGMAIPVSTLLAEFSGVLAGLLRTPALLSLNRVIFRAGLGARAAFAPTFVFSLGIIALLWPGKQVAAQPKSPA